MLVLEGVLREKRRLFLVDTGWGITTLDEATARGMKTLNEQGVVLEDPVLGPITNSVLMEKLTLGGSQFLNQPATVQRLEMDYSKMGVDGILGCDFLLRNFCLVDCGSGRLYFRSAKRSLEDSKMLEESLRRRGFTEVPMQADYGFTIDAKIKDMDVRWVVDTGAFFSVLDEPQVSRLSLTTEKVRKPETGTFVAPEITGRSAGVGAIGAHMSRITTPITLRIGARTWKNTRFLVVNLKSWGLGTPGRPGENVHGLLGEDLLISSGALIDFSSSKLWFSPEKPGSRKG
jgi:hypothetical protein